MFTYYHQYLILVDKETMGIQNCHIPKRSFRPGLRYIPPFYLGLHPSDKRVGMVIFLVEMIWLSRKGWFFNGKVKGVAFSVLVRAGNKVEK